MFATLRSVSRMKRALRKSDRGTGARLSIAVEIEEEEDYMSTFMWYGGNCVFWLSIHFILSEILVTRIEWCERCLDLQITLLSILKHGGVCNRLDVDYKHRQRYL